MRFIQKVTRTRTDAVYPQISEELNSAFTCMLLNIVRSSITTPSNRHEYSSNDTQQSCNHVT